MAGEPFKPVGPAGAVEIDSEKPCVGEHTARIRLDASEPHGIALMN